jgi:hypothetical protein
MVGRLQSAHPRDGSWPSLWYLTALIALVMGVGQMMQVGGFIAELGRQQARSAGWYDDRRGLQAVAIAVFGLIALFVVFAVIRNWRRRRRIGDLLVGLLMSALVVSTMARVVSLHQVDSLLWRRGIAGARFGTLLELVLLAAVIALASGRLREELAAGDAASSVRRVSVDHSGGPEY